MAAPLESSGHPPQGDQPTIWRAPSQETAPTTRYNGRWATSSLVCVPAALRECRGRTRAGKPPRATGAARERATPRGRPSQGTAGSIPRTGGHQPKDWQALFFNKKRLNDFTKLLEADVSEVVCGVLFWFGGLVFLRLFYAPGVFFFSFVSASSFDWHGADYALAVVHTLVLVGMSVSVCRDASLQLHAELWELMVMIDMSARTPRRCSGIQWLTFVSRLREESVGSPVLPGRLYSSLCNQTRTLSWTGRVAMEIVFRSLRSDKDTLLDQPCCQGDCVPAFTIRHGSLLHEESLMQLFLFGGTGAD